MKTNIKYEVYQQSICTECAIWLSNDESHDDPNQTEKARDTLGEWFLTGYTQAGPNYDEAGNIEEYFDGLPCDLCNAMPGQRMEWNFLQEITRKGVIDCIQQLNANIAPSTKQIIGI